MTPLYKNEFYMTFDKSGEFKWKKITIKDKAKRLLRETKVVWVLLSDSLSGIHGVILKGIERVAF